MTAINKALAGCLTLLLVGVAVAPLWSQASSTQAPTLSSTKLDFDSHAVGTRSDSESLTLTNNTGSNTKFKVAITSDKETVPDYQIEDNGCKDTIAVGANCSIAISFLALAEGQRNAHLDITYPADSKSKTPLRVLLTGSGVIPDISISSTQLYFEPPGLGNVSAPQTVAVVNNSQKDLVINRVAATGDFLPKTATLPRTLKRGEFLIIAVSFVPTGKSASNSGMLSILTSEGIVPDVYLYGNSSDLTADICPASAPIEIGGALLLSLFYWLIMVLVRWHRVARPTRELLTAQIASVETELALLNPSGSKQILELLDRASRLLKPDNLSRANRVANFLFWSRGQEITGWGYVHEGQIRMAQYLAPETIVARLESAEQKLRLTNDVPCIALANSIHQTLTAPSPDALRQKALLTEALNINYGRSDNSFADLVSWQNKTSWLIVCGLTLIVVLIAAFPHHSALFLVGAAGGLISRLSRSLDRKDVPTDYGASWTTLFLSPVSGALGAWAGVLVCGLAYKLNILGQAFNADWSHPCDPGVLAIALVFGFSERLLDGVLDKLVEKGQGGNTSTPNPQPPQKASSSSPTTGDGTASLKITAQKLPDGKLNQDYPNTKLETTGSTAALTWSAEGSLPTGLKLDQASGVISGKPVDAKTSSFTVRVADALGRSATQGFTITINP
jgi:Putative Ig domain